MRSIHYTSGQYESGVLQHPDIGKRHPKSDILLTQPHIIIFNTAILSYQNVKINFCFIIIQIKSECKQQSTSEPCTQKCFVTDATLASVICYRIETSRSPHRAHPRATLYIKTPNARSESFERDDRILGIVLVQIYLDPVRCFPLTDRNTVARQADARRSTVAV